MKNMNKRRKGISLIVLVITILVMIILAGVVVVSLSKNNPIEKAKEANFKTDVSSFASELGVGLSNSLVENSSVKPEEIFANKFVDMKKYINSFSKKYENKLVIADGKLTYIGGNSKEEKWSEECGIEVFRGVNKPVLSEGMIPIKYENNSWVICSENDPSWYNYGQKLWANVMLSDGKYKDKNLVGTKVTDADLGSMFVWIPRYAYSINEYKVAKNFVEGTTQEITNITFLNSTSNSDMQGNVYLEDYSDIVLEGESTPKIVHPAFNFGRKKLKGIWVAKFEGSMKESVENPEAENDTTEKTLAILPDKKAWDYITVGNAFANCYEMKNKEIYGLKNVDTHLMKNIEWGAVSYLAASKYGVIPAICNEQTSYETNFKRSTTGNETGIYDLNGGAWEMVAAYYDNNNNNLSTYAPNVFTNNKLKQEYEKYFDKYDVSKKEYDLSNDISFYAKGEEANKDRVEMADARYSLAERKIGDAMYEVTKKGGYSYYVQKEGLYKWLKGPNLVDEMLVPGIYNYDMALIGHTILPFVYRGGNKLHASSAGVFAYYNDRGYSFKDGSFRPVLINK